MSYPLNGHGHRHPPLSVELARTPEDVRASQLLRYQVFAREQGATLESGAEGLDRDYYDKYCHHLLVRETDSGRVVGSTRILTTPNARDAGSFYSENEFDLSLMFPRLLGNAIEVGRTCIDPAYRNGPGISMLWKGLSQFMEANQTHYLFGCASVSMRDGGAQAAAIMARARKENMSPEKYRVTPRVRMLPTVAAPEVTGMPTLLRAYLKLGAWVAGEPCIDPDFNTADFFVLLDTKRLNKRYHRFFTQTQQTDRFGATAAVM
ncbi:MAG: GNAT family N-acyltransferase [Thiolinea sp.]